MPKFMYVFRGGGYATPQNISPTEIQAHLARWKAWSEMMMARGGSSANALSHPPSGAVMRGRERVVTDGPYAESKDLVSGVFVVEAPDLAAATELARDCPIFEFDGSVEIRPLVG
jgi:hypothetical protein